MQASTPPSPTRTHPDLARAQFFQDHAKCVDEAGEAAGLWPLHACEKARPRNEQKIQINLKIKLHVVLVSAHSSRKTH